MGLDIDGKPMEHRAFQILLSTLAGYQRNICLPAATYVLKLHLSHQSFTSIIHF